jgi:putative nucleotidyltransferase with HDIG domain
MLPTSLRLAEVVSALSQALDLGSGSSAGHSVRTCILGMRISRELRLSERTRHQLFYALLLKDAGGNGNPGGLSDGATACSFERGAALARLMKLPEATAAAIEARNEHWNGHGYPKRLKGEQIPIASRIALVAQMLDILFTSTGPEAAIATIRRNSGLWFDPEVSKATQSVSTRGELWADLTHVNLTRLALRLEPAPAITAQGNLSLETICRAFAMIVDSKSPFTYNHSNGVANVAVAIAKKLELDPYRIELVGHAALLHDVGKMAVPSEILQKPGKLSEAEWQLIRSHPEHTRKILGSIRGFEEMSEVAAAHHERLDGSGYCRGLKAPQLILESRILAVADVFDALSAWRPYRNSIPREKVLATIRKWSPHILDGTCVEALEQSGMEFDQTFKGLSTQGTQTALRAGYSLIDSGEVKSSSAATGR